MAAPSTSSVANLNQPQEKEYRSESLFSKALRRLRRDYITQLAIGVVLLFTLLSFGGPWINANILNVNPDATSRTIFAPIGTPGHILGTDDIGRDQLARLLVAGQVSLGIGFSGALISLTIGLVLGVSSGYFGGIFDDILNWIITTIDSIPSLYLFILIAAVLRPDATSLVLSIALISWTGVTRIIRGQTFAIRNLDYVLSVLCLTISSRI
jgi:peptide/nickel transport system permease protein